MDESEQRRAQRLAITLQCVGCLPALAYGNGFMLSLLERLGLAGEQSLRLLGMPSLVGAIATVPLAFLADRIGVRIVGTAGMALCLSGSLLLLLAAWMAWPGLAGWGIALDALGAAAFGACWFALIDPIVTPAGRGRFFGRLRMSWQTVGIIGGFSIAAALHGAATLFPFVLILAAFPVIHLLRIGAFHRIPDRTVRSGSSLASAVGHAAGSPGYLAFGSYLFLLRLAVGAIPWIFGLLQQQVHHMPPSDVVLLANLVAVGSLAGFWLGGRMVDRHGPKPVFLIAHGGYALVAAWVLLRSGIPLPAFAIFAVAALAWGAIDACSGIAVTTEVLNLAPERNKALAISLLNTLGSAGVALSAWAGALAVGAGLFRDGWTLFGLAMSAFDGLLIIGCFLVLTFVVTLGLVPSVLRRHQDLP
jgi:MFS family permease